MKLIMDNYLEQVTEDLEIINHRLGKMFDEAVTVVTNSPEDEFSLLEAIEIEKMEETISIDSEKYEMYNEALTDSLKAIWKAIVRFVKMVFVSSGKVISTEDAKNIIESLKDTGSEEIKGAKMKAVVQKGFYLIAGLGTSVDGASLKRAYDNGNIVDFVTANIGKININKIPADSKFRICVASYDKNVKNSLALTMETLQTLATKGINAIKDLGSKAKSKIKGNTSATNESVDLYEESSDVKTPIDGCLEKFDRVFGDSINKDEALKTLKGIHTTVLDLKNKAHDKVFDDLYKKFTKVNGELDYAVKNDNEDDIVKITDAYRKKLSTMADYLRNNLKLESAFFDFGPMKYISEKYTGPIESFNKKITDKKVAAATTRDETDKAIAQGNVREKAAAEMDKKLGKAAVIVGAGAVAFGVTALVKRAAAKKTGDDHIDFATIVYVNENTDAAMAKVRLYTEGSGVKTIDVKGKEKISQLKNDLIEVAEEMNKGDNLGDGVREHVHTFAQNILTVFSGLANKSAE